MLIKNGILNLVTEETAVRQLDLVLRLMEQMDRTVV
jgi:hypothetical protein